MATEFAEDGGSVCYRGVRIHKKPGLFTRRILRSMRLGRYETAELRHAERCIEQGERILDIGAGVGFLSTKIAQIEGVDKVVSVEANPALIDVIQATFEENDVSDKAECLHGILGQTNDGNTVDFYIRKNFWASSLSGEERAYTEKVEVPILDFNDIVAKFAPTLIICDIEGGEADLFQQCDLRSVSHLVIEVHPGIYGQKGLARVFQAVMDQGFVLDIRAPRAGDVLTFMNINHISE
ncbi:FkbM family methyltransferase [Ruegeria sp. HKCCA6837]|uniref:FkbM family methyltransferase n=1 Tax=Ruegeria sp. HKCCA6837 TaxID=2682989 RepID=UPI0014883333|nr:FkbM family methyltransferase [Ruegeria sp. HKCCA6837]